MAAPEEEYYYDSYSGTAGREIGKNGAHQAALDAEEGLVHKHTHPNGLKVYDNHGDLLLRAKARSKAEAHAKFSVHPEYSHMVNEEKALGYPGGPEWED